MNKYLRFLYFALFLVVLGASCSEDPGSNKDQSTPTDNNELGSVNAWTAKIARSPDNSDLYASRANAYLELNGYDEAITDLKKAISLDSTKVIYHHALADVYLDYFKSSQALKTMEKAAELFPDQIPTLLKLSEFQLILKKHNRALISIDRILKIDPYHAEAFFMTGRVFEDQGEESKAIRSYEKAVEYDPDLVEVWIKLGLMLAEKEDPKAIRYFENAILVDSLNVEAHFAKSSYLHNQGKLEEAIRAYRNIHRIAPQYANAYYNCGLAYMELDSIDQGQKQFDLAIKMKPTYIMAYFYRGIAAEMKGDTARAKKDFQQALNLNPGFERAQQALDNLQNSN